MTSNKFRIRHTGNPGGPWQVQHPGRFGHGCYTTHMTYAQAVAATVYMIDERRRRAFLIGEQ